MNVPTNLKSKKPLNYKIQKCKHLLRSQLGPSHPGTHVQLYGTPPVPLTHVAPF